MGKGRLITALVWRTGYQVEGHGLCFLVISDLWRLAFRYGVGLWKSSYRELLFSCKVMQQVGMAFWGLGLGSWDMSISSGVEIEVRMYSLFNRCPTCSRLRVHTVDCSTAMKHRRLDRPPWLQHESCKQTGSFVLGPRLWLEMAAFKCDIVVSRARRQWLRQLRHRRSSRTPCA
jgi:hypothetical protein